MIAPWIVTLCSTAVFADNERARDIYSDFTWNHGVSNKLGEIVRYGKRKIKEKKDGQEGG